jgi:hypothetical protein
VIDGTATVTGARVDTLVAVHSTVDLGPGTVVAGDVLTLDSTVHRTGDAAVLGAVTEITPALVALGAVLAPAAILFWIGFGLATIAAGLLLAGVASRQVRDAERLIAHEPVRVVLAGIAGVVLVPIACVLLMLSIVGAPLGIGVLFMGLPLIAYVGYLVAGIWVGEWILAHLQPGRVREKPYVAAVIGLLVLGVIGLVPLVNLLTAVASLLGFGAVLLAAWRAITGHAEPGPRLPMPAPMGAG